LTPIEALKRAIYCHKEDVNLFQDPFVRPQGTIWGSSNLRNRLREVADLQYSAGHRFAWAKRFVEKFLIKPGKGKNRNGHFFVAALNEFMVLIAPGLECATPTFPGPVDRLNLYNATVGRLEMLDTPLSNDVYFWGIYLSAEARSTGGLNRYLRDNGCKSGLFAESQRGSILWSINRWVLSDTFSGWEGRRRKQALLNLCSGWERKGVMQANETRQTSLRDMVITTNPVTYFSILRTLGGIGALFDEWTGIKENWPKTLENDFNDPSQHLKLMQLVEGIVLALLEANAPERAWKVIGEAQCRSEDLMQSTWEGLLDYPEYIKSVSGDMSEHILRKYEHCLEQTERSLGIRWSGGETGFHLPDPRHDLPDNEDL